MLDYNYDSVIINEIDLVRGGKRLLDTDTSLVLPYDAIVRFLITSSDVLHAWAVPEFGIKVDAVPGRLNQAIITTNNLGIFYGQCSELCGVSHGFMPIKVNVITFKDYYTFLINKDK
jgi:cytochrome c oxidase subunit 2